jgi:diguanylate cyclase (GGDEF)-like protein
VLPNQGQVTVSIGIASCAGGPCEIADLVNRADQAVYAAKTTGRNRIVRWTKGSAASELFAAGAR